MKIILSMEMKKSDIKEIEATMDETFNKEKIKEELKQMLFEVCEDWVIRGDEPALEFKR